MIETGRVIAERFHGELIVAYVSQPEISPADQAALDAKLAIARAAGATIEVLDGEDPVDTILDFARARGITQLFIAHSGRSGYWTRIWGNQVDKADSQVRKNGRAPFPRNSMEDRHRGRLKIYMGYAAGVGKIYQMLDELCHLKERGIDVVVGYVECHGPKDTFA